MRIGIDLMGGDTAPEVLFDAVLQAAKLLNDTYCLVVIATKTIIDRIIPINVSKHPSEYQAKIEYRFVANSITMDEEPLKAFKRKKEASMLVGIRLLKKGQIDALVSCGNTGALVAGATLSLPMLSGIQRPALLATLPTEKGPIAVLDVGGNVACKTEHLVQFAHLGAAYQRAMCGIQIPIIGLLNIGIESGKGTKELRQAYEILKTQCKALAMQDSRHCMHFAGNIEGRNVFKGTIDVLVTNGFTGNVLLKTAEGAASFIFATLNDSCKDEASEAFTQRLDRLKDSFNYTEHPGAFLCGIDGIVIKSHGNSNPRALLNSIMGAIDLIKKQVIPIIKEQLIYIKTQLVP